MILILVTAFLLGIRHALDPDHVVAVSTLAAEERRIWRAARLGFFWGLGHLSTIAVVGIPLLLLRLELPAWVEDGVDLGVGVLLVGLGLATLLRLRRERVHLHVHSHGDEVHMHFHTHHHGPMHAHPHRQGGRRGVASFAIGCAHGLAGSGAAAVLALAAAGSPGRAAVYLVAFGLGTVLGMLATTFAIAGPAVVSARRLEAAHGWVRALAGTASIAVGAWMWVSILGLVP